MLDFFKNAFKKEKPQAKARPKDSCPIEINEGDKISIHKDDVVPRLWRGVIQATSRELFAIDIPDLIKENPFPFKENTLISASINKGEKTALFSARMRKVVQSHKPPIVIMDYPEEVTWEESKQGGFIRIKTDLPAKVKLEGVDDATWHMVRIVEFSLKGLVLSSPSTFMEGRKVRLDFMSLEFPLSPVAEVIWSKKEEPASEGDSTTFNVGVQLEGLSQFDEQILASFAYKLQRRAM
jgi:hypothetical protein